MKPKMNKAITLMELLVALAVTSIVVLYFFAIEKIGRQDLINADYRTKVQNTVSYVLDHMTKNISTAIGNTQISSQYPIDTTSGISGCNNAIKIWIDYNNNGQRDSGDKQIAYCYSPTPNYQIWYYSNYTDSPISYEVITGNRIMGDFNHSNDTTQNTYVQYNAANNYLDVQITGCWDPSQATYTCGNANNPSVTMHSYIRMPSVTTN